MQPHQWGLWHFGQGYHHGEEYQILKPREQIVYAKDSRVREVTLPRPFGAQNTMSKRNTDAGH